MTSFMRSMFSIERDVTIEEFYTC
ncbi:unnamed protein product [Coffea canephora]|uniref:DH200=94 genomic scaffold, scaffold_964 n=1 Tax=Coffea canephora TaxID=49390 RepID=A0A068VHX0_COFCA|nr:unnamed protein product [Coffea canephora]